MQPRPFEQASPTELRWNPDGTVGIAWNDGHESSYDLGFLRAKCPCATCKGTHGPPTTLVVRTNSRGFTIAQGKRDPGPPDASIQVQSVDPVGSYAMKFTWADGHATGLYSYRYLRSLCPCASCEAGRSAATVAG